MKKVSMRKLSLLGLVLIGASAVTAAVLPKDETKKTWNGKLNETDSPIGSGQVQKTCEALQSGSAQCTYTATIGALSSTTTADKAVLTSDLTQNVGPKKVTDTAGPKHSSLSPV